MFSIISRRVTQNIIKNNRNVMEKVSATYFSSDNSFENLSVKVPKPYVYHVELNRPDHLNAFSNKMWIEIGACFNNLANDADCRVIILTGSGKLFTAGADLQDMISTKQKIEEAEDIARKSKIITLTLKSWQDSLTSLEICNKPVIAAVHNACVGAGVDLVTAADIRYCTKDAWFQVKEVDIGMAADVGTLQRLPKVIGSDSLARELCYTVRKFPATEALSSGFVSKVFENKESMLNGAIELATVIASKSPVAIQGTKMSLVYSRDHTVQEGLDQIGQHNKMAILSEDFTNAVMGQASKNSDVVFSKL